MKKQIQADRVFTVQVKFIIYLSNFTKGSLRFDIFLKSDLLNSSYVEKRNV